MTWMRTTLAGALALAALSGAPVSGGDKADDVAGLIERLGSEDFEERDQAQKRLRKIGAPALSALRQAAEGDDAEARKRARSLADAISSEIATAALLAPAKVKFDGSPATAAEVVAVMSKASGYRVELPPALADRKVTVKAGELTFLRALDALGQQASVSLAKPAPQTVNQAVEFGPRRVKDEKVAKQAPFAPTAPALDAVKLVDGKPRGTASHAGSVLLRVSARKASVKGQDVVSVTFDGAAEPRLRDFRLLSVQAIDKAVDEHGQSLAVSDIKAEPTRSGRGVIVINGQVIAPRLTAAEQRSVTVNLKRGDKATATLRELAGAAVISALYEPDPFGTLAEPLKAAGKSAQGRAGYSLAVASAEALGDGEVRLSLKVTQPLEADPAAAALAGLRGRIVINGVYSGETTLPPPYPRLEDAEGRAWELVRVADQRLEPTKDGRDCSFVLTYRPPAKGAKPAKLCLVATVPTTAVVPFSLKDVAVE